MTTRMTHSRSAPRLRFDLSAASAVSSVVREVVSDSSVSSGCSGGESGESAVPVTRSAYPRRRLPPRFGGRHSRVTSALFLDLRLLAAQFAQVVQLRAADIA